MVTKAGIKQEDNIRIYKLTPHQREEINHYIDQGVKQEWIAKQFGVHRTLIAYYKRKSLSSKREVAA